MDKIKSIFEKQKNFFEKIKKINNNLMQSLENDIQIKERIINNYNENKFNYNSFLNMNNLFFHNNERYESILENILSKNDQNQHNEDKQINCSEYINNYLSVLYYALMINNEETINDCLIKDLALKVSNIITPNINYNSNISKVENQLFEEKFINNNNSNNYNYSKINSTFSFNSNKIFSSYTSANQEYNFSQINSSSDIKGFNKINNQLLSKSDIKNNIFQSQTKIKNMNIAISKSFSFEYNSPNLNNSSNNRLYNSINSIPKTHKEKINISNSSIKEKQKKEKQIRKTESKEENKIDSEENKENYSNDEDNNRKEKIRNNNMINNMILLKSGNVAVSIKEAIEIYNLRKLDFSGANNIYGNEIIKNNCLIQTINIVKGRYINYVFELFDQTLLCATYSKLVRIKLTNHDSSYETLSFIKIGNEFPRNVISLGTEFLVILTEVKNIVI